MGAITGILLGFCVSGFLTYIAFNDSDSDNEIGWFGGTHESDLTPIDIIVFN